MADDPRISRGEKATQTPASVPVLRKVAPFHVPPLERRPLSLNSVTQEISRLLTTAINNQILVESNYQSDLPAILADAAQMQQVVMNLITNASDAIGIQPGSITIRTGERQLDRAFLDMAILGATREPGHYVLLEVEDTGSGIREQTRRTMFDPFFSTKADGRGLGLAALHGIVSNHGGVIRVASEPGQGTLFQVFFPASAQPAEVSRWAGPPKGSGS